MTDRTTKTIGRRGSQPRRVVVELGIGIPMRDGVRLVADVYRPYGRAPRHTLVMRTPYGRRLALGAPLFDHLRLVEAGYALLIQDVRGRGDSEGGFSPFRDEGSDGVDTIAWAASQPWSTGRVGMIGASYVGATQWLAAAANPPALYAIAPLLTAVD